MLIAALTAGLITIAPEVNPVCLATGLRLLSAVRQEQITNDQAGALFSRCQELNPPLSP